MLTILAAVDSQMTIGSVFSPDWYDPTEMGVFYTEIIGATLIIDQAFYDLLPPDLLDLAEEVLVVSMDPERKHSLPPGHHAFPNTTTALKHCWFQDRLRVCALGSQDILNDLFDRADRIVSSVYSRSSQTKSFGTFPQLSQDSWRTVSNQIPDSPKYTLRKEMIRTK